MDSEKFFIDCKEDIAEIICDCIFDYNRKSENDDLYDLTDLYRVALDMCSLMGGSVILVPIVKTTFRHEFPELYMALREKAEANGLELLDVVIDEIIAKIRNFSLLKVRNKDILSPQISVYTDRKLANLNTMDLQVFCFCDRLVTSIRSII